VKKTKLLPAINRSFSLPSQERKMAGTGSSRNEVESDPNPGLTDKMPLRPYRVLHADLPFYSDAGCRSEMIGARLVVLRCEDPRQKHQPIECMPSRKKYSQGQIVCWELNNKKVWNEAWYRNPGSGKPEKAWSRAVEFAGHVVKV
jgi:hypothetical protein